MFIIWSSNGGPIQNAVMLILFLAQLFPFLLNNEASFEHASAHTSVPPNRHSSGTSSRNSNTRTATFRYSASYTTPPPVHLPWKTLALTFLIFFIVIFSLFTVGLNQYRLWIQSRYENIPQNNQERQAREMREGPEPQPQARQQQAPQPEPNRPEPNLQGEDAYNRSSRYWLLMGLAAGLVCGIVVWGAFLNNVEDPSLSQNLSDIALSLGSLLQFGGFVWMMARSFVDARRNTNRRNRANPARLARIMDKIRDLPVEEFVENDKETYSKLKISQLKYMLRNRGDTTSYLEKNEMESALLQTRKYDETCCICYEDYCDCRAEHQIILLRILPKCGHEFHLECLDQWASTFERKRAAPSCPLCKTEF